MVLQKSFSAIFGRLKRQESLTALFLLLILTFSGLLAACGRQKQWNPDNRSGTSQTEEILKFKSKYVGDNSNTIGLIDALGMPKGVSRGDIELQTKKQPFGIIINCKLGRDSELVKDGVLDDNPFYRNAIIMFSLIDNADTVEVRLEDGAVISFVYTREMAQQSFRGADVRAFAKSPADFEAFLKKIPVIERPAENPPQSGV